jgi:hypothetical protein
MYRVVEVEEEKVSEDSRSVSALDVGRPRSMIAGT